MATGTAKKDATRRRLIVAAARAFREHGLGGIGVDGVAKAAGVTSGAFYASFASKADVFAATVASGLEEFRAGIAVFRDRYGTGWARKLATWYLSAERRADLGGSCALPLLSLEVARADAQTRAAYDGRLLEIVGELEAGLAGGPARKRSDALAILALLSGGMTMAHAVADERLSARIASAVRDAVVEIAERTDAPPNAESAARAPSARS